MSSVYHAGEIEVQTRAGVREMARRAGHGIHTALPRGAAEFLAEQPMVIVSGTDEAGCVWASVLAGRPGFARALDERTVSLRATPPGGDPLATALSGGAGDARLELGVLVIDLETRERMRLNGPAEGGAGRRGSAAHPRSLLRLSQVHPVA